MEEQHGLLEFLPKSAISLDVHVADWKESIQAAGAALVNSGATDPAYTDEMIKTVEALGTYIVIAPGLALAHSRPSPAVHHTGFSWVKLATPVPFGNPDNDPVELVVGLAAVDDKSHVQGLSVLANLLSDDNRRKFLMSVADVDQLYEQIRIFEQTGMQE